MNDIILRKATKEDIHTLSNHHARMFEEMFIIAGKPIDKGDLTSLHRKYQEKLENQLPTSQCQSVIAEKNNKIIASGAVSIMSYVPVPGDLNHEVGYIHTIYTEKNYRKRGVAKSILNALKELCQQANLKRVFLFSSNEGESLYKEFGFCSAPEAMRLFI